MKQKTFGPGLTANRRVSVGIDQSYSGFGLTFVADDGSYRSTVTKFESRGVRRLVEVQEHVCLEFETVAHSGCEIYDVAMEGYAYGSQMANTAGELGAAVKLELYKHYDLFPLIVPPTSLKKYVTGKGNASGKSQIMLQVYKHWNVELLDDNAADSYALARIASKYASTAYQQDVLIALEDPKHRDA